MHLCIVEYSHEFGKQFLKWLLFISVWFHQYNNDFVLKTCTCNHHHVSGLVQERCNSIVNTLVLHHSCTNPLICNSIILMVLGKICSGAQIILYHGWHKIFPSTYIHISMVNAKVVLVLLNANDKWLGLLQLAMFTHHKYIWKYPLHLVMVLLNTIKTS